jgi:hypothetical protein
MDSWKQSNTLRAWWGEIMIKEVAGCIEIQNFLDLDLLNDLIKFTNDNIEALTKKEFKNKESELINKVLENQNFRAVTEKYSGKDFSVLLQNKTTNINTKSTSVKSDTELHYDGCYINWVIPLILDNNQEPGLIIFPNSRKSVFKFLGLKLAVFFFGSPFVLRSKVLISIFGGRKIKYLVNHAYVFDGYNSLHGVARYPNDGARCVITINFRIQGQ